MRRISFIILLFLSFIFSVKSKTIEEQLINAGAWFLFSTRLEQLEGDTILTQIEFFKKEDVSSLLFDHNNRLYSVFSDKETEMNEDLWKLLNDNSFVISDMTGETMQIMEIVELTKNKLILKFCDEKSETNKCIISTYFTTKAGWLSDSEIDKLNSTGVIKYEETD